MKNVVYFMKQKKILFIILGFLILLLIALGLFFINKDNNDKNNNLENRKLIEKTYTMYVKINPLIRLEFKETFYECINDKGEKEVCSSVEEEVINYELVNNDAKEIYYNTDLLGKNILDALVVLCDTATDNDIFFTDFKIITDWENMYNEEEINNALKEKSKYETEYKVLLDFQQVINKEEVEDGEEVKNYTVRFDTDTGSKIDNQLIKENEPVKKPKDPTKDGYVFVEWQLNGKKFDFKNGITEDIILKAKWDKVEVKEETEKPKEEIKPSEEEVLKPEENVSKPNEEENEITKPDEKPIEIIDEKIEKNIDDIKVDIKNLNELYNINNNNLKVNVKLEGKKSIINSLNKDSISLFIDLKNYKKGTYDVEILIDKKNEDITYSINPNKIKITLTEKDTSDSRIEKINLNENILFYRSGYGYGSICGQDNYKMFATNLETLFPGYVRTVMGQKTITRIEQSDLNDLKNSEMFKDYDFSGLLIESEWLAKYNQITFDTSKENNLINVFNSLKSMKTAGIDSFDYDYSDHKLYKYSFGTIDLVDKEKFITLNKHLEELHKDLATKIDNAVSGMYHIEKAEGGCGDIAEPEILTEEICARYNLTCDRW